MWNRQHSRLGAVSALEITTQDQGGVGRAHRDNGIRIHEIWRAEGEWFSNQDSRLRLKVGSP